MTGSVIGRLLRGTSLLLVVLVAAGCTASSEQPTGDRSRVEPFRPDDTRLSQCGPKQAYDALVRCTTQAIGNIAARGGPSQAAARVERALARPARELDRVIAQNCHRTMHAVGAGSVLHFGGSLDEALAAGVPLCLSGYHHGVIEHAAGFGRDAGAATACSELPEPADCLHGLGHGFVIDERYDRERSLARCRTLGADHERPCFGGAMMELFMVLRPGSPAGGDGIDCAGIEPRLATMCARAFGAGRVWTIDIRNVPNAAAMACDELSRMHRPACAEAVGETIGERAAGDEHVAERTCAALTELRRECDRGRARFASSA